MRLKYMVTIIFMILVPRVSGAVELGDAQKGLVYARQICAECHAVEAGEGLSPSSNAPSFEDVANTPGMTKRALVVWLQTSHPTMPNLIVPPNDTDDIVAYIQSLRVQR